MNAPRLKQQTGGTKILPCTCQHDYQDVRYGKGQRVHNRKINTKEPGDWRCTVCGRTR